MPVRYRESWVVKVGKEAFFLDEKQIVILKEAMKQKERWVSFKDFILSIPHIECIYLNSREIADQLPEGEKKDPYQPIPAERWEKARKEFLRQIGKPKNVSKNQPVL